MTDNREIVSLCHALELGAFGEHALSADDFKTKALHLVDKVLARLAEEAFEVLASAHRPSAPIKVEEVGFAAVDAEFFNVSAKEGLVWHGGERLYRRVRP